MTQFTWESEAGAEAQVEQQPPAPAAEPESLALSVDEFAALDANRLPFERGLILSEEDRIRRQVIMRIMCDRRIDYTDLSRRLGVDFAAKFAREIASLADLESDGLLRRTPEGFVVTGVGALLIRIIAMRFDAYLEKGPRRFSKTV